MISYKCFKCGKKTSAEDLEKRFTCSYCNSKIFYKERKHVAKVKAE